MKFQSQVREAIIQVKYMINQNIKKKPADTQSISGGVFSQSNPTPSEFGKNQF